MHFPTGTYRDDVFIFRTLNSMCCHASRDTPDGHTACKAEFPWSFQTNKTHKRADERCGKFIFTRWLSARITILVIAPEMSNLSSLQIIDKPFDSSLECAFLSSGHNRIFLCAKRQIKFQCGQAHTRKQTGSPRTTNP